MNFEIVQLENGFALIFNKLVLCCADIYASIGGVKRKLGITKIIDEKDAIKLVAVSKDFAEVSLSFKEAVNTIFCSMQAKSLKNHWGYGRYFDYHGGVILNFTCISGSEKFLSLYHEMPFWLAPKFSDSIADIPDYTEELLVKTKNSNLAIVPFCGENFNTRLCGNENSVDMISYTNCGGITELNGSMFSISISDNPITAVENIYSLKNQFEPEVLLRTQRKMPDMFEKLGWCSWNACYQNVNEELILNKARELKEKNIPVKWFLIDDGWSMYSDDKLTSFYEDRTKFPNGLAHTISVLKKEYQVEYVGVWHAINGYWKGISPGSEVANSQRDNLTILHDQSILPAFDETKAYHFFNAWHTYLKNQGVDFVKVDNQSGLQIFSDGNATITEAARAVHRGLEQSIAENFDGAVINCMGMAQESIFSRNSSSLNRNSDDFFPHVKGSFCSHAIQNGYSAIFHRNLYHCDWDMWWTNHESAVQSGVLRAISGSPVYISDKIDETEREMLIPLLNNDGSVIRFKNSAIPTMDCIYTNCATEEKPLKLFNTDGDTISIAVFNVFHAEKELIVDICLDDFGMETKDEYVAYSYFEKKFYKLTKENTITFSLSANRCEIINIFPVFDGKAVLGDLTKYASAVTKEKNVVDIHSLR